MTAMQYGSVNVTGRLWEDDRLFPRLGALGDLMPVLGS